MCYKQKQFFNKNGFIILRGYFHHESVRQPATALSRQVAKDTSGDIYIYVSRRSVVRFPVGARLILCVSFYLFLYIYIHTVFLSFDCRTDLTSYTTTSNKVEIPDYMQYVPFC